MLRKINFFYNREEDILVSITFPIFLILKNTYTLFFRIN
uniref:Uncharacterized protein n=1 Tax=Glaucocystis incrassata TaxID=1789788 RepID=A0A3G1IV83_9EUKA|nr:hypothetical protein [Glaucocystis incrassata]ASQ39966.1 hypothetical protein [Glaucocystis incrassata]